MVQVSDMVQKVKPGWMGFLDLRPPDEHTWSSRENPKEYTCAHLEEILSLPSSEALKLLTGRDGAQSSA